MPLSLPKDSCANSGDSFQQAVAGFDSSAYVYGYHILGYLGKLCYLKQIGSVFQTLMSNLRQGSGVGRVMGTCQMVRYVGESQRITVPVCCYLNVHDSFCCCFKTGSHYIALAFLELTT